ncbi:Gfo/Idh/MocA family protein [Anthocerotibacter panamensis]|uniref:Gfo/Idh/MocA family protein n=1 Tax=Anthocerotibacter panamensis TaxID=2857077 RepID=UPI001C403153|nr:Gfo/Idh/MocA family oxidoreductase [Anthocerotibacter panamensis]
MAGRLRVIVVGCGLMGLWHTHAARQAGAEVVGFVDSEPGRAQKLAGHKELTFPNLETALQKRPAEVVHICTPLHSHVSLVELALKAGCHVLAEKPLAPTLTETTALITLAQTRGLKLNPVHQFAFQRGFQQMLTERKRLGSLVRLHFSTGTAGGDGRDRPGRRAVLLEILPHPVALFCQLLGQEPALLEVHCFTDNDLALGGQCNETLLSAHLSLRSRPTHNTLTVAGTLATAHLDLYHGYALFEEAPISQTSKLLRPLKLGAGHFFQATGNLLLRAAASEPAYPGLNELVRRFYLAVQHNTPAPVPDQEILAAAQWLEQVRLAG